MEHISYETYHSRTHR